MDIYLGNDTGKLRNLFILIAQLLILAIAYWVTFQSGGAKIFALWGGTVQPLGFGQKLIFVFAIITVLRFVLTLFVLLKRKIHTAELISVPIAFACYYIGFALFAQTRAAGFGMLDIIAIAVFALGCVLNTGSELQRYRWKKNPENKGHLYTEGLFKHSMHINFLGDILWVSAFAIATQNLWALSVPLVLIGFFVFDAIPNLDAYLSKRYSDEFPAYAAKTKKLLPWVY